MNDEKFQWSFIGVAVLAVLFVVLAITTPIPGWFIAIAVVGGIAGEVVLLHFWGKDYMSRI